MRLSLVVLWWQVSRHDPEHRPAAYTYMVTVGVAQIGWVLLAISHLSVGAALALTTPLFAVEMAGPFIAERKRPTPWHAHHIAERYGLLVIITLGEVISGTVASLNVLVHGHGGWSVDAVLLTIAGVGLAFGCWWMYFAVPWAAPLVRHRERAFQFGYGHLAIFASLAATGAGVHVAALRLGDKAEIGATATVLMVAVPFAIFVCVFYLLYSALMRTRDPFHLALLAATAFVVSVSIVLAAAGVNTAVCLVVLTLAPAVTVVGYETLGHRHVLEALDRL
jgi:low temperature requirement protein LtrA